MKFWRISSTILGLMLIALVSNRLAAQDAAGSHTYYVDFDGGSDSATGTSQSSPWKHAPGDSQASGVPAKTDLVPGDTVAFRAGVTYRGSIQIGASGVPDKPITYIGQGWGEGRAILSGRDAFEVAAQPCSSLPECSNLPDADKLIVLNLPVPVSAYSQITLEGHILQLAESPKPLEPFWFDDVANYATTSPDNLTATADSKTWQIQSDFFKKTLAGYPIGDLIIMVQGYPNLVSISPVIGYDPKTSSVQFVSPNFARNQNRDVQFALANHPRLISQPYEYATIEHGSKIVVRAPTNSIKLEISRREMAFYDYGPKSITIKGFDIEGYTSDPKDGRGGVALGTQGTANIVFDNNDVHDLESWAGSGAIGGQSIAGISITNNRFHDLPHGSGLRIGKASDMIIARNEFRNIGRTGILIMDSEGATVDHNILSQLYGSHGNGISIYRDNHDILVSNNLVKDTTRAITFEGAGPTSPPNNIIFRANLLKANGSGGVALQSWGGNTKGVIIEQNVLLVDDSMYALRLSGRDSDVTVRQNVIDGYQGYPMPLSSDTSIEGNIFVSDSRGSTSGNDIRSSFRKAADVLFSDATSVDPKVCDFLLGGTKSTSGIGPNDVCKTR